MIAAIGFCRSGAARSVRALPRAPLPAHPHGVSRRTVRSARCGVALCALCAVVVGVAVVTLGLAYPWAQASLQRFKMRHTCYGDLLGAFEGSGSALFLRGLPIWLLVVGPIVFAFLALGAMVDWDALSGMIGGRRQRSARSARRQYRLSSRLLHRRRCALHQHHRGGAALSVVPGRDVALVDFRSALWRGQRHVRGSPLRRSIASICALLLYIVPFMLLVMMVGGVCVLPAAARRSDRSTIPRSPACVECRHARPLRRDRARRFDDLSGRGHIRDVAARRAIGRAFRRRMRSTAVRASGRAELRAR